MDLYNQLRETTEWQTIELLRADGFGSFKQIKIKLEHPWLFKNSGGNVWLHQNPKLSTAKGYWCLDGREFLMLQKNGRRFDVIATIHVEDCGMGSAKARVACDYFGYRFQDYKIEL